MSNRGVNRLSVVMPNRDHGRYLNASLEAILSQSWAAYEVIVVDDASVDDSVNTVRSLQLKYSNLRLFINEHPLGPAEACSRGILEATGEYLYLAAADDRVLPGFFQSAMDLLSCHPEAGLCIGSAMPLEEVGGGLKGAPDHSWAWWAPTGPAYADPGSAVGLARAGFWFGGGSAIFKRDAFETVYVDSWSLRSDIDWFAATTIAFRDGIGVLPTTVMAFRSLPTSYSSSQKRHDRRAVFRDILALLESDAYSDVKESFKQGAFEPLGRYFLWFVLARPGYWRWLSWPYLRLRAARGFRSLRSRLPGPLRRLYRRIRPRR